MPDNSSRNLSPPRREVASDFKCDGDKFDAPHFSDEGGEGCRPAAGLPPEDDLQRLPLPFVCPFIDEKAHPDLGLTGPNIAFKRRERQQIESVEPNVAETTLSDMPGEQALARVVSRCLSKFARAWNVATAYVEPIADNTPFRDGIRGPISMTSDASLLHGGFRLQHVCRTARAKGTDCGRKVSNTLFRNSDRVYTGAH